MFFYKPFGRLSGSRPRPKSSVRGPLPIGHVFCGNSLAAAEEFSPGGLFQSLISLVVAAAGRSVAPPPRRLRSPLRSDLELYILVMYNKVTRRLPTDPALLCAFLEAPHRKGGVGILGGALGKVDHGGWPDSLGQRDLIHGGSVVVEMQGRVHVRSAMLGGVRSGPAVWPSHSAARLCRLAGNFGS